MRIRRILAAVLFVVLAAACAGDGASQSLDKVPVSPGQPYHHVPGGGFRNPEGSPTWKPQTFDFVRFILARFANVGEHSVVPDRYLVPREQARAGLAAMADPRITWIGHSTFLIGLGDHNILTDPFFSNRASPLPFAGPERFVPPGLDIDELPPIDTIVISHNHYDHMDVAALKKLAHRFPDARVLVPLGDGPLVRKSGFTDVRELDWYDTEDRNGLNITAVPAIHRSARGPFDLNETLWCGYVLSGAGLKIWFAGDTGAGPVFNEVAKRVGPVDVALVPIGGFLPRDVLRSVHVTPEEAVELARIMGAKTAIGMHWGTLPLGDDTPLDAIKHFDAADPEGVTKVLMKIGETRSLAPLSLSALPESEAPRP